MSESTNITSQPSSTSGISTTSFTSSCTNSVTSESQRLTSQSSTYSPTTTCTASTCTSSACTDTSELTPVTAPNDIRPHMVTRGVNVLRHPEVQNVTDTERLEFLRSQGLSPAEIVAVQTELTRLLHQDLSHNSSSNVRMPQGAAVQEIEYEKDHSSRPWSYVGLAVMGVAAGYAYAQHYRRQQLNSEATASTFRQESSNTHSSSHGESATLSLGMSFLPSTIQKYAHTLYSSSMSALSSLADTLTGTDTANQTPLSHSPDASIFKTPNGTRSIPPSTHTAQPNNTWSHSRSFDVSAISNAQTPDTRAPASASRRNLQVSFDTGMNQSESKLRSQSNYTQNNHLNHSQDHHIFRTPHRASDMRVPSTGDTERTAYWTPEVSMNSSMVEEQLSSIQRDLQAISGSMLAHRNEQQNRALAQATQHENEQNQWQETLRQLRAEFSTLRDGISELIAELRQDSRNLSLTRDSRRVIADGFNDNRDHDSSFHSNSTFESSTTEKSISPSNHQATIFVSEPDSLEQTPVTSGCDGTQKVDKPDNQQLEEMVRNSNHQWNDIENDHCSVVEESTENDRSSTALPDSTVTIPTVSLQNAANVRKHKLYTYMQSFVTKNSIKTIQAKCSMLIMLFGNLAKSPTHKAYHRIAASNGAFKKMTNSLIDLNIFLQTLGFIPSPSGISETLDIEARQSRLDEWRMPEPTVEESIPSTSQTSTSTQTDKSPRFWMWKWAPVETMLSECICNDKKIVLSFNDQKDAGLHEMNSMILNQDNATTRVDDSLRPSALISFASDILQHVIRHGEFPTSFDTLLGTESMTNQNTGDRGVTSTQTMPNQNTHAPGGVSSTQQTMTHQNIHAPGGVSSTQQTMPNQNTQTLNNQTRTQFTATQVTQSPIQVTNNIHSQTNRIDESNHLLLPNTTNKSIDRIIPTTSTEQGSTEQGFTDVSTTTSESTSGIQYPCSFKDVLRSVELGQTPPDVEMIPDTLSVAASKFMSKAELLGQSSE